MQVNSKPCSYCGKPIIWGYTAKKEPHPFDARPTLGIPDKEGPKEVIWVRISHFVTCPGRGGKKR